LSFSFVLLSSLKHFVIHIEEFQFFVHFFAVLATLALYKFIYLFIYYLIQIPIAEIATSVIIFDDGVVFGSSL